MEQLEIQASNIKCGGCVANIKNGLKEIGITDISVDIKSNVVTVKGEEFDKTSIENRLKELGYL